MDINYESMGSKITVQGIMLHKTVVQFFSTQVVNFKTLFFVLGSFLNNFMILISL